MREDVYINEVLAKCEVFKKVGIWPSEPLMRPNAWLRNFEDSDRYIAAVLLDKFNYYNETLTNRLLIASYNSISDGLSKGPQTPKSKDLVSAVSNAVFTLVEGENPNLTDSGYTFCRRARQVLRVDESLIVSPIDALTHASKGGTVVFLDDFIGSGDQFKETWERKISASSPISFKEAQTSTNFNAIYISLACTSYGLANINTIAPYVAVCSAHFLTEANTYKEIKHNGKNLRSEIEQLLHKYAPRLTPKESHMQQNLCKAFGYKLRGLLFGFSHSIPDATLPIFWSPGTNNWEPLIERV